MMRVLPLLAMATILAGCAGAPDEPEALGSAAGPSAVTVSVPMNFRTHLSGDEEVPPRETRAQGQAIFQLQSGGLELSYHLIAANIENPFMAHIHMAPAGANGGIVAWLWPSTVPGQQEDQGLGRLNINIRGVLGASDLTGALAGRPLSDLIDAIQAGNAYVNVHTSDGVNPPNTGPGDFPGGEVRGQI